MADKKLSKRKVPTRFSAEQARKLVFAALDQETSDDEALSDEESIGSLADERPRITSDSDSCGTLGNEDPGDAADPLQQGKSGKTEFEYVIWFHNAVFRDGNYFVKNNYVICGIIVNLFLYSRPAWQCVR